MRALIRSAIRSITSILLTPLRGLMAPILRIKKIITSIIKKIVGGFTIIFFYIRCGIKMITNFYKCVIFYILDVLKYLFFYVLSMIPYFFMNKMGKWNSTVKPALDKALGWPNGIRNMCYRCKEKKYNDNLANRMRKMFENKGHDDNDLNFFTFMLIMVLCALILYGMWYTILYKKHDGINNMNTMKNMVSSMNLYEQIKKAQPNLTGTSPALSAVPPSVLSAVPPSVLSNVPP